MEKDSNFDAETTNPSRVRTKLNTKGCCFMCLTVIPTDSNVASTSTGGASTKPLVSLRSLQRYFRIRSAIIKNTAPPPVSLDIATTASQNQQDIDVELCESCENVVDKFKDAFLSLEKAQMEVDYWSGKIHYQISEGSKRHEQVQNYSKRMTSDPVTLIQLVVVDNLRKDIVKNSLTKRVGGLEAKIYLHKSQWRPKIQLENDEDKMNRMSPMKPDSFNDDVVSEEDSRHSTLSLDDADNETDARTIVTIKDEKPHIFPPSVSSPEPLLTTSSEPQTETKLVNLTFVETEMFVKNQKTGSYSCTSCNKMFKSKQTAKSHYEAIHLGKRYTCEVCESKFTETQGLKKHKRSCNGKKRNSSTHSIIKRQHFNSKTGTFACAGCSKEFKSSSGAYFHYQTVHLEKKYKCEVCNMAVFSYLTTLNSHQKTCERTLKSRLSLKLKRESDPKFGFPCLTCGKRFVSKPNMKSHFRTVHMKERNHSCDICGKKYSTGRYVRLHKEVAHFGREKVQL